LGLVVLGKITAEGGWALPKMLLLASPLTSPAMFLIGALHLILCQIGRTQQRPQRVTKLRVVEFAYLGRETQWVITSDSIKVKVSRLLEEKFTDTAFAMGISTQQRDWLLSSFDKTYLSTIKSNYDGHSQRLHDFGYHLAVYKGSSLAVTDIYKYKLNCFYVFCQRLNQLLPAAYRMNYTVDYFKR
jgi:hypothetical protein